MKKIFLLAFSCLALLSCSSDDESSSSSTAGVIGTWNLTAFTTSDPTDFNNDGALTTNFLTESGCYDNSTLVLGANNVATINLQEMDVTFEIDFVNPELSEYTIDCLAAIPEVGTWAQNNNSVTVTVENEPVTLTLNGNTLTLVIDEFIDIETFDGTDVVYSFTGATLVFTKQ